MALLRLGHNNWVSDPPALCETLSDKMEVKTNSAGFRLFYLCCSEEGKRDAAVMGFRPVAVV